MIFDQCQCTSLINNHYVANLILFKFFCCVFVQWLTEISKFYLIMDSSCMFQNCYDVTKAWYTHVCEVFFVEIQQHSSLNAVVWEQHSIVGCITCWNLRLCEKLEPVGSLCCYQKRKNIWFKSAMFTKSNNSNQSIQCNHQVTY